MIARTGSRVAPGSDLTRSTFAASVGPGASRHSGAGMPVPRERTCVGTHITTAPERLSRTVLLSIASTRRDGVSTRLSCHPGLRADDWQERIPVLSRHGRERLSCGLVGKEGVPQLAARVDGAVRCQFAGHQSI